MEHKTAAISKCERYRYRLSRSYREIARREVTFIGVNPSTADAFVDDATVRKWVGFASRWGFDWINVVNLFAWRATDVRELASVDDPVGPANDDSIRDSLWRAELVVPCWGSRDKLPKPLQPRIKAVWSMVAESGRPVKHLGLTSSGDPKHPLMLAYSTPLVDWSHP